MKRFTIHITRSSEDGRACTQLVHLVWAKGGAPAFIVISNKARVRVHIYGIWFACFFAEILPAPGKGAWAFLSICPDKGWKGETITCDLKYLSVAQHQKWSQALHYNGGHDNNVYDDGDEGRSCQQDLPGSFFHFGQRCPHGPPCYPLPYPGLDAQTIFSITGPLIFTEWTLLAESCGGSKLWNVEGNTDLFLKSQRLKLDEGGCGNRSSRETGDNIDVSLLHPKERNHMDDLDKPQAFSGHWGRWEQGKKALDSLKMTSRKWPCSCSYCQSFDPKQGGKHKLQGPWEPDYWISQ